ncbi:MAG: Undecaprenyl-diphosphatase [Candidatus Woesebacteria bacterium GW2011_GWB1_45_5]|uniref:Undecaprenyl-diphosphatase n=1 Tax=Candidatus Woesebacteria bacterium GW2011_GWB1_45_5 TaxID=1618581 RepID=A0A0G1MMS7_9BACT|nr:MAG: Undecaprenyl-diphosphatase [Candidatus Woesebacteria bacterium GW2011_GWB1_45_5]
MDFIHVLILSAVEGLTEFLPISSTGHLILISKLLGITESDFTKTFEIAIQLGAILSIVVLYFKKFITDIELYKKLFFAFIPTAAVGFFLYPFIKGFLLGSSTITLITLFLGGFVLIFFKKENSGSKKIGYKEAFLIGVFQSVSIIPGVSRAAATIIGGLLVGLNRKNATEFSFLLAVPTMFAATALDIYKSSAILNSSNVPSLLTGTFFSFIFAMLAVKFLVDYVKTHDFTAFGVYRILLAALFWLFVK